MNFFVFFSVEYEHSPFKSGGSSMMGLHSNFGSNSAPPPLDLSEFPSLSSKNTGSSQPNPMAGRQPYGESTLCRYFLSFCSRF